MKFVQKHSAILIYLTIYYLLIILSIGDPHAMLSALAIIGSIIPFIVFLLIGLIDRQKRHLIYSLLVLLNVGLSLFVSEWFIKN